MSWIALILLASEPTPVPETRATVAIVEQSARVRIMSGVKIGPWIETEFPNRLTRRDEVLPSGRVVRLVILDFE